MKSDLHDITEECLVASADAHHIAGELMVNVVDPEAMSEAAKQLERAARKLRKCAEAAELAAQIKKGRKA